MSYIGKIAAARKCAMEAVRNTFTKEDFLRNMDDLWKYLTPQQIYDLYEMAYLSIDGPAYMKGGVNNAV